MLARSGDKRHACTQVKGTEEAVSPSSRRPRGQDRWAFSENAFAHTAGKYASNATSTLFSSVLGRTTCRLITDYTSTRGHGRFAKQHRQQSRRWRRRVRTATSLAHRPRRIRATNPARATPSATGHFCAIMSAGLFSPVARGMATLSNDASAASVARQATTPTDAREENIPVQSFRTATQSIKMAMEVTSKRVHF